MTKRMLIDATQPEETRVVVVQDQQLVDFDFESSTKRQLKGNIYLAKVTRVEPSLQAAFVDYGGNRHGFLAFSEIHPDYYQIPQADRETLEKIERDAAQTAEPDPEAGEEGSRRITEDAEEETAEVMSEQARRRARLLRSYKIQEVIKRRQIMLVQVVKEERGSKGAALTTYLSLPGRYCVLMPNTPRGGGISRKISNTTDRQRLKSLIQELKVPEGMGLIVRTAGQQRLKSEIKRDYEYLLRQWSEIRDTTLNSIAPALIYEEGDLIKRAMRDLYTRDIEEVLVEGEEGYRTAKRLMQMMMPSRARNVRPFKEELPLFFRYRVEDQLDAMHSPTVQLPSGGSIVIHSTEALTAIDVNSGRSTRERHIDETAVKTNLEAADEVARQLRLRDLAGLIVVDFIDMSEGRHQRQVERRFREALKLDRARLQVGKISMFGLLELSRQRLRPSLQELSSQACPTCKGLGVVRSTESLALQAMRMVQEEGIKGEAATLQLRLPSEVGLYLLNRKREALVRLEQRYAMRVMVNADRDLLPPTIELNVEEKRERPAPVEAREDEARDDKPREEKAREEKAREQPGKSEAAPRRKAAEEEEPAGAEAAAGSDEEGGRKRRRRRRRRRRGDEAEPAAASEPGAAAAAGPEADGETDGETDDEAPSQPDSPAATGEASSAASKSAQADGAAGQDAAARPRRRRGGRRGGRSERQAETEGAPGAGATAAASRAGDDAGAGDRDAAEGDGEAGEPAEQPAATARSGPARESLMRVVQALVGSRSDTARSDAGGSAESSGPAANGVTAAETGGRRAGDAAPGDGDGDGDRDVRTDEDQLEAATAEADDATDAATEPAAATAEPGRDDSCAPADEPEPGEVAVVERPQADKEHAEPSDSSGEAEEEGPSRRQGGRHGWWSRWVR